MGENAPVSKTQRKKEVAALQELGAELVRLNDEQLASIALPEALRAAVIEARRISRHEARRRQLQYIGKLMRRVDVAPIRAALDAWSASARSHTAQFKRVELWRERLLAEPAALTALLAEYPGADAERLRVLIRDARHEREASQPPRSFRALHRALRALIEKDVSGES